MRRARELRHPSPCNLIQEHLRDDPWRVLVACMLMNMTVGLTMRPIMWKLFERWSCAEALAHADEDELRELIRPLGFYNRRAKSLVAMSRAYVTDEWHTPRDLPGCGKYAEDSWKIFCTDDDVLLSDLKDKELRRFVHWLETGEYVPQDRCI
jgi:methyl-CpG-binding domain protein 4